MLSYNSFKTTVTKVQDDKTWGKNTMNFFIIVECRHHDSIDTNCVKRLLISFGATSNWMDVLCDLPLITLFLRDFSFA